jgi:hypothetical protein
MATVQLLIWRASSAFLTPTSRSSLRSSRLLPDPTSPPPFQKIQIHFSQRAVEDGAEIQNGAAARGPIS